MLFLSTMYNFAFLILITTTWCEIKMTSKSDRLRSIKHKSMTVSGVRVTRASELTLMTYTVCPCDVMWPRQTHHFSLSHKSLLSSCAPLYFQDPVSRPVRHMLEHVCQLVKQQTHHGCHWAVDADVTPVSDLPIWELCRKWPSHDTLMTYVDVCVCARPEVYDHIHNNK